MSEYCEWCGDAIARDRDRREGAREALQKLALVLCPDCAAGVPVSHTGAHVRSAWDWRSCKASDVHEAIRALAQPEAAHGADAIKEGK